MTMATVQPPSLECHLAGMKDNVEKKITRRYRKKVRPQDVGKNREFKKLIVEFYEAYERKKIEEAVYKEKIKNAPKGPSIPTSSSTCRFKRMESKDALA